MPCSQYVLDSLVSQCFPIVTEGTRFSVADEIISSLLWRFLIDVVMVLVFVALVVIALAVMLSDLGVNFHQPSQSCRLCVLYQNPDDIIRIRVPTQEGHCPGFYASNTQILQIWGEVL